MERFIPDNWTIEEPTEYVLWEDITLEADDLVISGHNGRVRIDPVPLEILEILPEGWRSSGPTKPLREPKEV